MRLLLGIVVMVALALTFWVTVDGQVQVPGLSADSELHSELKGESTSLVDDESGSTRQLAVDAGGFVRYYIIDAYTGAALSHAQIYVIRQDALLEECDADGSAVLNIADPGELFYYAEGYLLGYYRLDPTQLRSLREQALSGEVTIELYPDDLTFPLKLDFRLPNGEPAEGVEYGMRMNKTGMGSGKRIRAFDRALRTRDRGFRWAWENQLRRGNYGTQYKFGPIPPTRSVRRSDLHVRLYVAGYWRINASTSQGLSVKYEGWIGPGTGRLRLQLKPSFDQGNLVAGVVLDSLSGEPVVDAYMRFYHGSPKRQKSRRTDEQGRFSFTSPYPEPMRVNLQATGYEDFRLEGAKPQRGLEIRLVPISREVLHGRVLVHGSGKPLVGAAVRSRDTGTKTHVDEQGAFALPDMLVEHDYIIIEADGYYDFEFDMRGHWQDSPRDFALVPDQLRARIEAGISSLVSGVARRPGGKPVSGLELKIAVDESWPGFGENSRYSFRHLDRDGIFRTPDRVACDAEGNFTFECGTPGLVRLQPMDGESSPFEIQIALGKRYENLVIFTSK